MLEGRGSWSAMQALQKVPLQFVHMLCKIGGGVERVKCVIAQCIKKYSVAATCQTALTRHVPKEHEVSY